MDFRQCLFQYRSYTPIPFLIMMAIYAQPTIGSLIIGFFVVLFGEFIRLWGVSIAGSETRTTGPVGGTFLITKGPFAYVRNPLYLGNIVMYFGIGVMSFAFFPWLPLIALTFFLFQYALIVSLEEEYLFKRFGDEYLQYCKEVSRFVPTIRRYTRSTNQQPDLNWSRGFKSEKRTLQAIGLLVGLLILIWQVRG